MWSLRPRKPMMCSQGPHFLQGEYKQNQPHLQSPTTAKEAANQRRARLRTHRVLFFWRRRRAFACSHCVNSLHNFNQTKVSTAEPMSINWHIKTTCPFASFYHVGGSSRAQFTPQDHWTPLTHNSLHHVWKTIGLFDCSSRFIAVRCECCRPQCNL
jgi:hypothetical protein